MRKFISTRWVALSALALCLSVRAGEEPGPNNTVRFEELPDAAQKALTLQADGDTLGEIHKDTTLYLVQFTAEEKKQEILIREDLSTEGPRPARVEGSQGKEMQWNELPQGVQSLLSSKFAGAPLDKILRRPVTYHAKVIRNGEPSDVRFTERGRILSEISMREHREREEMAAAREREFTAKREAEKHDTEKHNAEKQDAEKREAEAKAKAQQ